MIRYLLTTVCLVMASANFAQKTDTLIVKTKVDCNHCRVCETCGQRFETDLYYVKGVKVVEYRDADTSILVVYKPKKTNPQTIRQAIAALGYDADDVPATPDGIATLDACCLKPKE